MLMITRRAAAFASATDHMTLTFEMRSRSRFRAQLATGEPVGVILERGHILRGGECLLGDDGRVVRVTAADETVTTVHADDAQALARAAYHLGNRHVALQIGTQWLRYSHDHVLDDMVMGLGARISISQAPFEPEPGAYAGAAGLAHTHAHPHPHPHPHRAASVDGD